MYISERDLNILGIPASLSFFPSTIERLTDSNVLDSPSINMPPFSYFQRLTNLWGNVNTAVSFTAFVAGGSLGALKKVFGKDFDVNVIF